MASKTATHGVTYDRLRDRDFREISMTRRTGNARLVVRCVAELHMSFGREPVHPYPGNLDILVSISSELLHFRFSLCHLGVTEHAFSDGWNAGGVATVGANMAIDAFHAKPHVSVVRKCDGLLGAEGNGAQCHQPRARRDVPNRSPHYPIEQYCIFSNRYSERSLHSGEGPFVWRYSGGPSCKACSAHPLSQLDVPSGPYPRRFLPPRLYRAICRRLRIPASTTSSSSRWRTAVSIIS
jgi:hypothetical protein